MNSIQFASNFRYKTQPRRSTPFSVTQSPSNNTIPATTKLFPAIKVELTIIYHHRHHNFRHKCPISIDFTLFCIVKIVSNLIADKTHQNFNFNSPNRSITSRHFTFKMTPKSSQSVHLISNFSPSNDAIFIPIVCFKL